MRRGFTLIELLGVIILLGVVSLIVYPIVDKAIKNSREKAYTQSVSSLLNAAELYSVSNDLGYSSEEKDISFEQLKLSGIVSDEEILNPVNNRDMTGCIKYYWDEDNKQYVFSYDSSCKPVVPTDDSCFETWESDDYDFDINYDVCVNYFINQTGKYANEEQLGDYCNGGYDINGYSIYYKQVYADNGVIYNIQPIKTSYIEEYSQRCGKDVVVPNMINDAYVIGISSGTFSGEDGMDSLSAGISLDSINFSLATRLKYIEGDAFYGSGLKSVIFGDNSSVSLIDHMAFAKNNLIRVTIPKNVFYIGNAFNNNKFSDDKAFIYNRNTDGSFNYTNVVGYAGVKKENVIIPDGTENIDNDAFENCDLVSITIPTGVKNIGNNAFYNNQLTSINIPYGVTSIGYSAFQNNKLENIDIPSSITSIDLYAFNNNQLPDSQAFIYARNSDGSVDNTKVIGYGGAKLSDIVIPNNVVSIYDNSFRFSNIGSITIPSSVTTIGTYAFSNNNISNLVLNEGLLSIGYGVFENNNLTSITIPSSVTSIGKYAFSNNNISNLVLNEGLLSIGHGVFENNNLTSVTIPSSVTSIDTYAFKKDVYSNTGLTTIYNNTNRAFNWGYITVKYNNNQTFITGTITHPNGDILVTN